MIKNFEMACPDVNAKIAKSAEYITRKHTQRMNDQMAVCEDILAVMGTKPMRVKEICDCYAYEPGSWRNYRYSWQKVAAMLKKLAVLGLVEKVLIEETDVVVDTCGHWGYKPEDFITVDGQQYVRAGAKQEWIDGEPVKVHTKIYGFVKIGA
jgi:hypothetical protein